MSAAVLVLVLAAALLQALPRWGWREWAVSAQLGRVQRRAADRATRLVDAGRIGAGVAALALG
jgi:hypothetical protein